MKKLALISALLPCLAMADVDTSFGLGLGTQYGGLAGFKFSVNLDNNSLYAGAGLASHPDSRAGLTLGWERAMFEKHSFGLAFRIRETWDAQYRLQPETGTRVFDYDDDGSFESRLSGTYTYYFTGAGQAGFLTGLSAGKTYRHTDWNGGFRSGMEYGFHLGYQF
ncbi:hypothetical protein [Microbulbifer guangxiensis]|uniref:hypothetical protein n=1 Tax=Microbulbifer guangxiensis TaxID=2904249 RepID=UPI001F1B26B6|nr:hypothetical protein [Microbulbifer guangxiensis]